MNLLFLRHGIAVEADEWRGRDEDRPLTKEGIARIKDEARAMADLCFGVETIVSSPMVRACTTATLVARKLKLHTPVLDDRLAEGFTLDRLRDIVSDYAKLEALMLVGHEPSLSDVIGRLIGSAGVEMKKGALAIVTVSDASCAQGALIGLIPPKVLAALGKARSR